MSAHHIISLLAVERQTRISYPLVLRGSFFIVVFNLVIGALRQTLQPLLWSGHLISANSVAFSAGGSSVDSPAPSHALEIAPIFSVPDLCVYTVNSAPSNVPWRPHQSHAPQSFCSQSPLVPAAVSSLAIASSTSMPFGRSSQSASAVPLWEPSFHVIVAIVVSVTLLM